MASAVTCFDIDAKSNMLPVVTRFPAATSAQP